jgi:hypothetical protein
LESFIIVRISGAGGSFLIRRTGADDMRFVLFVEGYKLDPNIAYDNCTRLKELLDKCSNWPTQALHVQILSKLARRIDDTDGSA